MDNTWGIATALRDLGIADKTEEDGGKLHTEYVTHGDPLAEDEEGPIEMHEQEYPEPGGNRRLPVSISMDESYLMADSISGHRYALYPGSQCT
jgi:hypothetical protein